MDDPKLDGVLTMYPTDSSVTHSYTMGHFLYRPTGYSKDPTKKWPILIFMHGLGEVGPGTTASLPKILTTPSPGGQIANGTAQKDARPFLNGFVLQPQSAGTWNVGAVHALLALLKTELRVDEDRIFVTGLSLGGGGAWEYGVTYPTEIAALVPISGTPSGIGAAEKLSTIPIWAFHAFRDTNTFDSLDPPGSLFRCGGGTPRQCTTERIDRMIPFVSARVMEGYSSDGGLTKAATNRTGALVAKNSIGQATAWNWLSGTDPSDPSSDKILTIQYQDAHDAWTQAYANKTLWSWLYAQKRVPPTGPDVYAKLLSTTTIAAGTSAKITIQAFVTPVSGAKIVEVEADLRAFGGSPNQKLALTAGTSGTQGTYEVDYTVPNSLKPAIDETFGVGVTAFDDQASRTVKVLVIKITH